MNDWKHVIWSDETKINCIGSDGRKWAWKKAGEGLSDRLVESTHIEFLLSSLYIYLQYQFHMLSNLVLLVLTDWIDLCYIHDTLSITPVLWAHLFCE